MPRYIDADALIRRWCGIKCGCERDECGREIEPCIVVMAIEEAPTIDAVPVVRCKDCVHCEEFVNIFDGEHIWECYEWHMLTDQYGYCHNGERKDDE